MWVHALLHSLLYHESLNLISVLRKTTVRVYCLFKNTAERATLFYQKFHTQMSSFLSFIKNNIFEIYIIYHEIYSYKHLSDFLLVYSEDHYCYLILEHIHHPKMKLSTHEQSLPCPLPLISDKH